MNTLSHTVYNYRGNLLSSTKPGDKSFGNIHGYQLVLLLYCISSLLLVTGFETSFNFYHISSSTQQVQTLVELPPTNYGKFLEPSP